MLKFANTIVEVMFTAVVAICMSLLVQQGYIRYDYSGLHIGPPPWTTTMTAIPLGPPRAHQLPEPPFGWESLDQPSCDSPWINQKWLSMEGTYCI